MILTFGRPLGRALADAEPEAERFGRGSRIGRLAAGVDVPLASLPLPAAASWTVGVGVDGVNTTIGATSEALGPGEE